MSTIGFFWLCRPGEHTHPSSTNALSSPFRMCDVTFYVGHHEYPGPTIPLHLLSAITFTKLTFSNQKNATTNERVGHGPSGDALVCPCASIARRVRHLRQHNAPTDSPLYSCYITNRWRSVLPTHITTALRFSASALFDTLGIDPKSLSAASLRAGGAMALLCADIDTDIIRLVGRWKSDIMIRYLHLQAMPLMTALSRKMAQHGAFTLHPGQTMPVQAATLLAVAGAATSPSL
jgi:hypothetical protein